MLALPGWCSRMSGLGGGGFVNEFKVAVSGDMLRQRLSDLEVVASVNLADWLGVLVAHINNPNKYVLTFTVLVGLRGVKENSLPLGGGDNRHGQRASCAQVGGHTFGFALGRGVHLGKFWVARFAGVLAFAVIDGEFHRRFRDGCAPPGRLGRSWPVSCAAGGLKKSKIGVDFNSTSCTFLS